MFAETDELGLAVIRTRGNTEEGLRSQVPGLLDSFHGKRQSKQAKLSFCLFYAALSHAAQIRVALLRPGDRLQLEKNQITLMVNCFQREKITASDGNQHCG